MNFRLLKQGGSHVAQPKYSLCASNATKWTRQLLEWHGYEAGGLTEKSMKVQGVTELFDAGESLENVMVYGRWRNQTTPMHYRKLSVQMRVAIGRKLPN